MPAAEIGRRRQKNDPNQIVGIPRVATGDPERIRTSDLPLRRRLLYPTELRDRGHVLAAKY
jgi:hypothetical protein